MSALNRFSFNGYDLRPTGPSDLALAERWTAMDAEHAGKIEPRFWLEQRLGRDSFILSRHGTPVFFFKMHILADYTLRWDEEQDGEKIAFRQTIRNCVQIFLQFAPYEANLSDVKRFRQIRRLRDGLKYGTEWLELILRQNGATEVFLDARSKPLIHFSLNRLGFKQCGIWLRKEI